MSEKVVSSRGDRFQQWQSYLVTRSKRTKAGVFLVQGVRPVTLAVEQDWPIESVLYRSGGPLSSWATGIVSRCRTAGVEVVAVAPDLMGELGERAEQPPEVLLLAESRLEDLSRWTPVGVAPVVVAFDRPSSPGNLGTLIRSSDAFSAAGVIVSGHAADPFDPACVRATTGSLFAVPIAAVSGPEDVLGFVRRMRDGGTPMTIVGTDETGTVAAHEHDFTGGTVLVVGNETRGMSAAWRDACDVVVSIPIGGAASSLGAPSAGAIGLYEIARQRLVGQRLVGQRLVGD